MAKISGEMHDKLEVEHRNPFDGIDSKTLVNAAENLLTAIKTRNGDVVDTSILSPEEENKEGVKDERGTGAQSNAGGDRAEERKGTI